MAVNNSQELNKWLEAKSLFGNENIVLGPYFSHQFRRTPRHVLFSLSRYKFAAKLLGTNKRILEIGCSEGLGTVLLAEFSEKVVALDIDADAVQNANSNFANEKTQFLQGDFLEADLGLFDGIVSFDVIEHIYPENEARFFEAACRHLEPHGICVTGTPNKVADCYAAPHSLIGHVNSYEWERLKQSMEQYFHQVFLFSANDEIIHTGFYPMAHYLIGVGIGKKE